MLRHLLLLLVFLPIAGVAQNTQIKEHELKQVRAKIGELRRSLEDKGRRRNRLESKLKEAEKDLLSARRQLAGTAAAQSKNQQRLDDITHESGLASERLKAETAELVDQLRAAYTSGRTERVRLLLNQQNPADLGRTLAYYGYLNSWRQNNIDRVSEQLAKLVRLREAAVEARRKLAALEATHRKELAERDRVRKERQELLTSLSAEIERAGGEVKELRQREADLERLILELSSILADYPISSEASFEALRGKLTWPVAGRLIHDFGQPREESALTWNGVLLSAPRGKEVRALYHGRVAFSDWLPGLGLLLVVDHGNDYLSLYGHNDSLLKNVGDWVAAGDPVATIGDSGGQSQPGLYLEIRHGTKPQNPRRWITKTPRE